MKESSVSTTRETLPETSGYAHPAYADSLSEFGAPLPLPRSGGWLLRRQIPGADCADAMGCYPIFSCADWQGLQGDLEELNSELISVALVTDPFGKYDRDYLNRCFKDVVFPFKEHFVTDLTCRIEDFVSVHHLRNLRKGSSKIRVEKSQNASQFLDDWTSLYENLVEKHQIKGISAFSRESFAKQLKVPGIVALRAVHEGATVGMLLWYVQTDVAYYHLGAYNQRGYELRASFPLFRFAVEYFAAQGLRWLDLGAGTGIGNEGEDGLARFKRGWSTGVRTAYFCGRIYQRKKYDQIVESRNLTATSYFPAYRVGEFH